MNPASDAIGPLKFVHGEARRARELGARIYPCRFRADRIAFALVDSGRRLFQRAFTLSAFVRCRVFGRPSLRSVLFSQPTGAFGGRVRFRSLGRLVFEGLFFGGLAFAVFVDLSRII
jgi:hypothetical protein